MTTLRLFLICIFLFVVHQFLQQWLLISLPFVDSYLDDILVMPVLLYLVSVERRFILNIKQNYVFSPLELVIITIVVGCVFEYGLPYFSDAFTFDYFDFLAYGLGTILFFFAQNEKALSRPN